MAGRIVWNAIVLVAVMVSALPLRARAAEGTSPPLFSLAALISVAPDLPVLSRSVLVAEAQRIWRREGVALNWSAATKSGPPSAPLRVLVISRPEALRSNASVWTVGELVPHTGQRALAIASIAGAERVVAASGNRVELLDRPQGAHYRLGVVLGRAVAHEIGHYLLSTATHAEHGLMRAEIGAREFADPGARTFTLDAAAGQWLRHRLPQAGGGPRPPGGFTYDAAQSPDALFQ
jgi:hypothetical protein